MTDKVVVLGNCQAAPFAKCLRMLNPSLDVKVVPLVLCKGRNAQERAVVKLRAADVIFRQPGGENAFRLAGIESLSAAFANLVFYPKVTFYGFHPDFLFLRKRNAGFARSACGHYHSIIVAAAFANGLPEDRTLRLFNSYIFARLGYLEKFAPWKNLLLSRAQELGYDLQEDFNVWLRDGAFMHTWQHPTIRVLASIAVRAMAKANLKRTKDAGDLPDPLARAVRLPVYPDIASAVGVRPIPNFRTANLAKAAAHDLSLEAFVRQTYPMYMELGADIFETKEIKAARGVIASELLN